MPRMPGATWRPLPRGFTTPMARYDLVVIHTMVGSLYGTDGYFRSGQTASNSHFGTDGSGAIWQWGDTANRSAANADGNHRSVTIENADLGDGFPRWNVNDASQVPAFTPAQLEANAQICAWAHKVHGIPLVAAADSKPGTRGIGYHRLGCDPYRVDGGERWSSSYGKVCPGARRIAQIPQIIARARQIAGGAPPAPEGPFMALSDAEQNEILAYVREHRLGIAGKRAAGPAGIMFHSMSKELTAARREIAALRAVIGADRGIDEVTLERVVRDAIADSVVTVDVNVAGGQQPTN